MQNTQHTSTTTEPTNIDDDVVVLGLLPSDTQLPWVAGTGPGFIVPTATAGGDALPITHPAPVTSHGPMASTGPWPQQQPHSITASNHGPAIAGTVMLALVTASAVVSLLAILDGSSYRFEIVALTVGAVFAFGATLCLPAVVRAHRAASSGWWKGADVA